MNELPTRDGVRMRWIMCCAYYLPEGMAAELAAAARAALAISSTKGSAACSLAGGAGGARAAPTN